MPCGTSYAKLNTAFGELFMDHGIAVRPETTARSIPHWNSMNHVNLLLTVESHFDVAVTIGKIEQLNTVSHRAALVERRRRDHRCA